MKQMRNMIEIDEEKCNGCGLCINGCHENALALVDGKARLVRESYCDGLGACLGECPQGALKIVRREADPFDEQAVQAAMAAAGITGLATASDPASSNAVTSTPAAVPPLACGCPGTLARSIAPAVQEPDSGTAEGGSVAPELRQWPIQLHLVPEDAPYWQGCDLLVAADCAALAYGDFQKKLLKGRRVVIACPKLDETGDYLRKLTEIIRRNHIKSVTVAHMEVPCCTGIVNLARQAVADAGVDIPFQTVKIGLDGSVEA